MSISEILSRYADIPPMSHMWPWEFLLLGVIIEIGHFVSYEIFSQGLDSLLTRYKGKLRLEVMLNKLKHYVRWCGRTHACMAITLFFGGYWWLALIGVGLLSTAVTVVTVFALTANFSFLVTYLTADRYGAKSH